MKTHNQRLALLLTLVIAFITQPALADKPGIPPGMAKYVMVLWTDGTPLNGTGYVKNAKEPDVTKFGGKVLSKVENRLEILLPKGVAKQLRKDPAVVYLQRIWMGEPLDDWDERYEKSTLDLRTESDTNLDWIRGFTYDGSGNVKELTAYAYDSNGNRVQVDQDHYTYDTAGRLIRAEVGDQVETYKYDDFGNLIEKAVAGANAVTIPVDSSSNRMTGPEYDVSGNVITRNGVPSYQWDPFNMLVRVRPRIGNSRQMIYDVDDERVGMLVVGDSLSRWTIRDFNGRVIREFRGDMAGMGPWYWEIDEIYADGQLVAGEKQPFQWFENGAVYGGFRHYHLDHLGSVRVVTNQSGADAISEHDYYPFGVSKTKTYQEQINWGDPHLDSMRFAGHWRDFLGLLNVENTEYLDYMHARYYDPNLGRFLSVDPVTNIEKALEEPQRWNRYSYALNNPLKNTDPDGRDIIITYSKGKLKHFFTHHILKGNLVNKSKLAVNTLDEGKALVELTIKHPDRVVRLKTGEVHYFKKIDNLTDKGEGVLKVITKPGEKAGVEKFENAFPLDKAGGIDGLAKAVLPFGWYVEILEMITDEIKEDVTEFEKKSKISRANRKKEEQKQSGVGDDGEKKEEEKDQ